MISSTNGVFNTQDNAKETVLPALLEEYNRPDQRIVGGSETDITKHPYQISIQKYGRHHCGGSILDSYHILTAAHCIGTARYNIRVGSSLSSAGGVVYNIAEIAVHEKYNKGRSDYDVAVVKLATPLEFSNAVKPVKLVEQDEELREGTPAVTTGWGRLMEYGPIPGILHKVEVPLLTNEVCEKYYPQRITARMICAGFKEGGSDACQGDSGGPLVSNGKQVGIVSWGMSCGSPDSPGVFARVAAVRDWIDQHTAA